MRLSSLRCRRTFLVLLVLLPMGACAPLAGRTGGAASTASGAGAEERRTYVYVGTAAGEIAIFSLDQATGGLRKHASVAVGRAPTSLAVARDGQVLVATNDAAASLVSFVVNPNTGALTAASHASTGGAQPGNAVADGSGKYVAVANQGSGSVAVLPVRPNGTLAEASLFDAGVGARSIAFHPSNEAAYVANFRAETLSQYSFNIGTGTLTPKPDRPVVLPKRSGPRSLVVHPNGRWLYVMNETANTIAVLAVEEHVRTLSLLALQVVSTLPEGWRGRKSQVADARLGRGGHFLYAINRGHDSVVTFAVEPATGDLTLVGHQPVQGQAPAALAVDASGAYLFVANQGSRTLATFRLDEANGVPAPLGTVPLGAAPLSVQAVRPSAD
jgi:6-phosphogluconolactonase